MDASKTAAFPIAALQEAAPRRLIGIVRNEPHQSASIVQIDGRSLAILEFEDRDRCHGGGQMRAVEAWLAAHADVDATIVIRAWLEARRTHRQHRSERPGTIGQRSFLTAGQRITPFWVMQASKAVVDGHNGNAKDASIDFIVRSATKSVLHTTGRGKRDSTLGWY